MFGEAFDATHQLIGKNWASRRSDVLGIERNTQGVVPVVPTLQQLYINVNLGIAASAVFRISRSHTNQRTIAYAVRS